MDALLLQPRTKEEFKLISALLEKMSIPSKKITVSEKEDWGLALMMHEANRNEKVSREEVMSKLRGSES